MPRYLIGPARLEDAAGLSRLARETPMAGSISISMEREPDYFRAAAVQSENPSVFVARCGGAIAGVAAMGSRLVYLNGVPSRVPYLSDLRIAPAHRKGILLARAYAYLRAELLHGDDFAQTVVVEDNAEALALLTSGRAGLPKYLDYGNYASPAVLLGEAPAPRGPIEVARADGSQAAAMQALYDAAAPRRQFQPCYRFPDMGGAYGRDLAWHDYFLAYRGGNLIGMAGIWDQGAFKQTRIRGYGGALRWLRPVINLAAPLLGTFPLPPPGAALPHLYLHALALAEDDPAILAALIAGIRHAVHGRAYAYLVCGLDAADPLRPALERFRTRHFGGRHFLVTFGRDPRPDLRPGPFYLEAARI